MGHYHSYLNSALQILDGYEGELPFASISKNFFSRHKKYGSRDRRQIAHLCYCFFRLGKALPQVSAEEKILIGLFLCSASGNDMLKGLKPEWNEKADLPAAQKLPFIHYPLLISDVFPWEKGLSDGIEHEKFCASFFTQPGFFLRVRPGKASGVIKKLQDAGFKPAQIDESCIVLNNASRIENIIEPDKEAIVQDYNSQQVGKFFENLRFPDPGPCAWDCCAGSGGKSLLLHDINPDIELTVSDIRESILVNLKKRFAKAGIKEYNSFVADLSKGQTAGSVQAGPFDLIICDAPCTGSGTWARTPEQLYFFDEIKIDHYVSLQKNIVSNVIPHLKENGYFVYVTCSVFKRENEEIADFIKNKFHPELVKMELLKGYDKKADTMFVALFRKTIV